MPSDDRTIHDIPVDKVRVSPQNVRPHVAEDDPDLQELAASIDKWGLLEPIVLRGEYDPNAQTYELLVGQRRWMAHRFLPTKKTIEAIFAGEMDDTEALIRSLTENLVRTDLTRGQIMDAVGKLYDQFKSDRKVAERTGLHITTVRKCLNVRKYVDGSERLSHMLHDRAQGVTLDDVSRALKAAKYDMDIAVNLLEKVKHEGLNPTQQSRLVALALDLDELNPDKVDQLVSQAQVPTYQKVLMVSLGDDARGALAQAAFDFGMSDEDLAVQVIEDWLKAEERL
ncbi:ParB/RepB/Spo0J family partition protein [bacterium]|nr:ParB/RepB/Spo0J family partition protein [bacterium]